MGEVLVIVLLFASAVGIVLGLPVAGLWWISRWLRRNSYTRVARIPQVLLLAFGILCSITIYSFYFPFDSEFENEFGLLTGLPFPNSGEVVEGEISGLDLQGDYFLTAEVAVDKTDYAHILTSISTDPSFHAVLSFSDTASVSKSQPVMPREPKRLYTRTFSKDNARKGTYQSISFLPNQRTITFHRSQN